MAIFMTYANTLNLLSPIIPERAPVSTLSGNRVAWPSAGTHELLRPDGDFIESLCKISETAQNVYKLSIRDVRIYLFIPYRLTFSGVAT
jgi:hypothetical protein